MDVFEDSAVETRRRSLGSATDKSNNAVTPRRSRTREVSSRYKSPASLPLTPRRCPTSPSSTSSSSSASFSLLPSQVGRSKRAVSADRRRPSTPPPSSTRLTTPPAGDTTSTLEKKIAAGGRMPEVLWPSTMRNLSVSFQSDNASVAVVSKKEKEKYGSSSCNDRALKPSLNVGHKQTEAGVAPASIPRKSIPESKMSPMRGRNLVQQSENSRPVDGVHARVIDQHRWPSRAGGLQLSASRMTKSVDSSDDVGKIPITPTANTGLSLRKLSAEGTPKPSMSASREDYGGKCMKSVDDSSMLRVTTTPKPNASCLTENTLLLLPTIRPLAALRLKPKASSSKVPSSPSRTRPSTTTRPSMPTQPSTPTQSSTQTRSSTPTQSSTQTRPSTPTRLSTATQPSTPTRSSTPKRPSSPTRPSTPTQSRGASPFRIMLSSSTAQSSSTASILSFLADIKKGKKNDELEDAHHLRLLYNRSLQWRFANARMEDVMYIQKMTSEQTLYDVWQANKELWDSLVIKRHDLLRLKLEMKLNSALREQIKYLEDWVLLELEHSASLVGLIKDLKASTLRLPVVRGAKADIDSLRRAINSAVDVMQATGASIFSLLSKVEGMNGLVSELAELAGSERSMLSECDALLASTSSMQLKEYSLRTQVIQCEQDLLTKTTLWDPL